MFSRKAGKWDNNWKETFFYFHLPVGAVTDGNHPRERNRWGRRGRTGTRRRADGQAHCPASQGSCMLCEKDAEEGHDGGLRGGKKQLLPSQAGQGMAQEKTAAKQHYYPPQALVG